MAVAVIASFAGQRVIEIPVAASAYRKGARIRGGMANIARLEKAGSIPSTSTLQRIAKATGHKLTITFTRSA